MNENEAVGDGSNRSWVIRNEFAMVEVRIDDSANDPLLMVQDMHSGMAIFLDALELEALTRVIHADLEPLLDPSGPSEPENDE